jgi:two-component system NtrC family sensor kinase
VIQKNVPVAWNLLGRPSEIASAQAMRPRTLPLLLCALLVVGTSALGGLSVLRKVASFQPLGFEPVASAGGAVRVGAVSDRRTTLQPGDQIVLVDGAEAGGVTALVNRLRAEPSSELAVARGPQILRLRYLRPPLQVDAPYLILALIGIGYLLIGLYTLLRHRAGPGTLFCLWCLVSAALYLLSPVPPLDTQYKLVAAADELAHLLLPPLTLQLFLIFPTVLPVLAGRRRLLSFLYLPAALLLTAQADLMLFNGRWLLGRPNATTIERLDRLDVLHLVAFGLAAIGVLAYRLLREQGWEQRRQLQWVLFGLAGGYIPFLLLYAVPFVLRLREPALLTSIAVLPLALVPVAFAYAILRYKLWDIGVIARDIVASALTLLLGIFSFSLVNLAITRGVSQELALTRNLLSFAAGLVIAGLLLPTRRSLSSALERLQYGGNFGKRRALGGLGRDLLHERDLGRLSSALLDRLGAGMDLERVNLYLAQREALVAVRADPGLPPTLPGTALPPEVWFESFRHLHGLASPLSPDSLETTLYRAGYRYVFPLTVRARGVGLVLVGYKQDQMPLNSEDAELVRHLLNQAALAIENAQLVGQLHLQLEEVRRLQTYSAGIFESSPAAIAVLDASGRVVSANRAFGELVSRPCAALPGAPLSSLLPDLPLPRPEDGPTEVSLRDANGRERHLQLSRAEYAGGQPAAGQPALSILVVHDVTERVEMEEALKEKDRLAALGMLAAGVAHEVNTPITGISSYAQMLLAETPETDPHYSILKKVERQTFRAARIVNNLLELARNRQVERRPVALKPLLAECLDLFSERLGKGDLELCWECPEDGECGGPILVLGSDGELQQVFTNLLANALDAMAGQPHGVLTVGIQPNEQTVRLIVRDSGPGVPEDKLDTIFQPFFTTKLHHGGTGLGLSISHDIIARHGGTLRVASTPGEGACFVVELPRFHPAPAVS